MTNFVPLLIHENVIFPLQHVELIVSNASQIELLEYCFDQKKPFGIGFFMDHHLRDMGVLAHCISIKKNEKNWAIVQIKTIQLIYILERIMQIPNKRYSGAIVSYPINSLMTSKDMLVEILSYINRETQLNIEPKPVMENSAYDLATKIITKNEEKYELLTIANEVQRLEYLRRYLQRTKAAKNFKGFSLS